MKLKPNLSKKSIFNSLEETCPLAMALFHKWINWYKEAVDWNLLFNADVVYDQAGVEGRKLITIAPKFHDLPLEMQIGILIKFFAEIDDESETPDFIRFIPIGEFYTDPHKYTEQCFKRLNDYLKTK